MGNFDESGALNQRTNILKTLKLGLTDMGKKVFRQQGSSNDHSLFPIEFMDIVEILLNHRNINTIVLTGSSQGNSSLSWFATYCALNDYPFNYKKLEKERETNISLAGRQIRLILTYSPSRLSRVSTDKLVEEYRKVLGQ